MKHHRSRHSLPTHRHWPLAVVALAGCSWGNVTLAQDPVPAASPESPDAAPSTVPAEVKKAPDAGVDAPATTTTSGDAAKPKSPFRTGQSSRSGGTARKSKFGYDTGDTGETRTKPARKVTDGVPDTERPEVQPGGGEGSETRFVAPSFYGRGQQVVTPGKGQYARPKFRYGISVGIGFDDNPDQVPSVSLTTVARPRARTGFTSVNVHWDAQWLKPTTVFTVSAEGGGDFFWDRPGNGSDFNGRLSVLYIEKITPRTQFSANGSFAYLSQPDYSNLYASTSQTAGDYFTGSTKFDLNYRWSPLFSTTTSASVNLLKYVNETSLTPSNSYWSFVFGNEFRFKTSPRVTWVAEGRYGLDEYINNTGLNSQTAYVLGGVDWVASRYLTANFRAGATFRSYDVGGSSSAPYAEVAVNYLTGRHSTLSLNGRYGYEQAVSAGDENLAYRFGMVYQHAFTSRFSANASFNFVHTAYTPRTGTKTSTDVYDVGIGMQYRLDRHFSLGARYSYILQDSSTGLQNFDRNRFLLSAQYEF
jgi:hypothetical protein